LVRFINFSTFRATNKKTGGIKQRLLSAPFCDAPIAQLDRALPSEGRRQGWNERIEGIFSEAFEWFIDEGRTGFTSLNFPRKHRVSN
jgi:hypothetical protein